MEDKINQALLQIEKDLEKVNSAREQVEKVTKSYSALKDGIDGYAKEMKALSDDTKTLVDAVAKQKNTLKEQTTTVANDFEKKCNDAAKGVEQKLENVSKTFSEKTNGQVKRMEEVTALIPEFKKDCRSLVEKIENLQNDVSDLDPILNSLMTTLDTISSTMGQNQQVLVSAIQALNDKMVTLSKEVQKNGMTAFKIKKMVAVALVLLGVMAVGVIALLCKIV